MWIEDYEEPVPKVLKRPISETERQKQAFSLATMGLVGAVTFFLLVADVVDPFLQWVPKGLQDLLVIVFMFCIILPMIALVIRWCLH